MVGKILALLVIVSLLTVAPAPNTPAAYAQEDDPWTQIEYGQSLDETLTEGFDGY